MELANTDAIVHYNVIWKYYNILLLYTLLSDASSGVWHGVKEAGVLHGVRPSWGELTGVFAAFELNIVASKYEYMIKSWPTVLHPSQSQLFWWIYVLKHKRQNSWFSNVTSRMWILCCKLKLKYTIPP